jgi:APA family basic amino acid/polyamine antiporter
MIVSVLGTMNATILTSSRVPFAMARDGLFFPSIANVNPERRVPTAAVTLMAAMGVVLVLTGTFEEVTALMVFGSWSFYGLSTVALFRLRVTEPNLPRPYRAIGYPVIPGLFLVLSVILSVSIVIEWPVRSLIGIGLILAGIPFYFYWKRRRPAG